MLPSNLNLSIRKKKGCNNKILVGNTDTKIGSNRNINKYHKKLPPDVPKIVISAARHDLKNIFDRGGWFDCLSFLVEK